MIEEIKTYEERKKELIKQGEAAGYITYEQLATALKGLDLDSDALDDLYNNSIFYPLQQDSQTQEYDIDEGTSGDILVSDAPNGVVWVSEIDANKSTLDTSNLNSGIVYPNQDNTLNVQEAIEEIDAFVGDSINYDNSLGQYKTRLAVQNIVKGVDDPTYSQS